MITGLKSAKILLPKNADMKKWACIACDQFTSEMEYWDKLEKEVGDAKSTLRLTLPEIYLEDNPEKRISTINANIKDYINGGVFEELEDGFIIRGKKKLLGGNVESYLDHRIAMTGAVGLIASERGGCISRPECCAISFPNFFDLLGVKAY